MALEGQVEAAQPENSIRDEAKVRVQKRGAFYKAKKNTQNKDKVTNLSPERESAPH